ncbi:MAG: hypothetical protein IJV17_05100 [Prevotella sp.]|nr:hypothetical protein [Prevotella sp.]
MKIFKFATVLLAMMAMTATFSSCSKDVDERVADELEAKQNFWMEVTLSNPGSLNAAAQSKFIELFNLKIYNVENKLDELICNPLYCTQDYATNNWNRLLNLPDEDNNIIQDVMKPVAKIQGVRDFEVTVTFSKDEKQTILGTKVYRAAEVISAADLLD